MERLYSSMSFTIVRDVSSNVFTRSASPAVSLFRLALLLVSLSSSVFKSSRTHF